MSDCTSWGPGSDWTQAECPPELSWGRGLVARLRDDGFWEWVGDWYTNGYRINADANGNMINLVEAASGQPQMVVLGEGGFLNFISAS